MSDNHSSDIHPQPQQLEIVVKLFTMLADKTRVQLILALRDGEKSVLELAKIVVKAQTVTSQHLAKLRLAHLVIARQEGTKVFYSLTNEHIANIVLNALHQVEHQIDEVPSHHVTRTRDAGKSP